MLKTIKENVEAEIVEKKSKFIANVIYVQTQEEAEEYILRNIDEYRSLTTHNWY